MIRHNIVHPSVGVGGTNVGEGGGAVAEPKFGSRHLQRFGILQYFFHSGLGLLQQSPPSQLHPALLFSVSHQPSWNHSGGAHTFGDGGVVVVVP